MAHTAEGALHFGVNEKKLAGYGSSAPSPCSPRRARRARFCDRRRVLPNGVSDDMFASLRKHWSEKPDRRNRRRDCHLRLSQPAGTTTMARRSRQSPMAVGEQSLRRAAGAPENMPV